ncbi:adenylyltransferase/cytidyltransferase family protein [Patescibacteria group bacterium]|nr:adenylyltransferase/cytidyltransferase family protein [Patescibacteria group bacterium]
MDKIVTEKKAAHLSKLLRKQGKKTVLIGGCFDILHIGHIRLIHEAKKQGDFLFVLLENDDNIKNTKGHHRPINSQAERAEILSSIEDIDYVILSEKKKNNKKYDKLVVNLAPNVIATTSGDKNMHHKKRQAELIKAKVIEVIKQLREKSTSRIADLIAEETT